MENKKKMPEDYLVWSILTTVFCCQPLGIVAIIYSAKVESRFLCGDYDGAQEASDKAKKFLTISAILGAVFWFLYICVLILAVIFGPDK